MKQYSRFELGDLVEDGYDEGVIRARLTEEEIDTLFKKVQGRVRNPLLRLPRGRRAIRTPTWEDGRTQFQDTNPEYKVARLDSRGAQPEVAEVHAEAMDDAASDGGVLLPSVVSAAA